MGTDDRPPAGPLVEQLANEPYRFDFFQAARLAELLRKDLMPVGHGGSKLRAARCDGIQWHDERRESAPVNAAFKVVCIDPHPARQRGDDALLHWMRGLVVAVGDPLLLHAVRQHAGVLAGAIVVDGAWFFASPGKIDDILALVRPMRAAFVASFRVSGLGKN